MKKQILSLSAFIALSAFSTQSFGQAWTTSGTDLVTNGSTNNVIVTNKLGIGTTGTLFAPLTINGHIDFETGASGFRIIHGNNADFGLAMLANNTWANGGGLLLNGSNGATSGKVTLVAPPAISGMPQNEYAFDFVQADGSGNFSQSYMNINKLGRVGINTNANDADHLTVNGNIGFETNSNYSYINGRSDLGITMFSNEDPDGGSHILLNSQNNSGDIRFVAIEASGGPAAFSFATRTGGNENERLHITKDGQVIIGDVPTVSPSDYKLYVQTGILTAKIKVATVGGGQWSDYVFADDYELKSLNDVEQFISKNKHLPDVPSAAEVEKSGYDVTTMDATLLQKIEELTLYVIKQQKEIEQLKSQINK